MATVYRSVDATEEVADARTLDQQRARTSVSYFTDAALFMCARAWHINKSTPLALAAEGVCYPIHALEEACAIDCGARLDLSTHQRARA